MAIQPSEFEKSLGNIGQALTKKDLREPANINALLDVISVLFTLGLVAAATIRPELAPSLHIGLCIIVALIFIAACLAWCIYRYSLPRTLK